MSFNDYEIIKEIGSGAMGVVYLARDPRLDRLVAIKKIKIPKDITKDMHHEFVERFYREARSIANLKHPNIVVVFELGEEKGINECFMVMEFLEGDSLETMMEKRAFIPVNTVLKTIVQSCEALHYIHQKQLIHRDIKPGNIFLCNTGIVKIMDFGLVRANDNIDLTTPGAFLGSILYMPVEQIEDSRNIDPRVDVYALGVTTYHVLTGDYPYNGNSFLEVVKKIQAGHPFPLTQANPNLPIELERIINKAIAKRRDDRFRNMLEFQEALVQFNAEKIKTNMSPLGYNRMTKTLPSLDDIYKQTPADFNKAVSMKANTGFIKNVSNKINEKNAHPLRQFAKPPVNNNNQPKGAPVSEYQKSPTNQPVPSFIESVEEGTQIIGFNEIEYSHIYEENLENIISNFKQTLKIEFKESETIYGELKEVIEKYNSSIALKYNMQPADYNNMMQELKKKVDLKNYQKERNEGEVNLLKEKIGIYSKILESQKIRKQIIDFINKEIGENQSGSFIDRVETVFKLSQTQAKNFKSILQGKLNKFMEIDTYLEKLNKINNELNLIKEKFNQQTYIHTAAVMTFLPRENSLEVKLSEDLQKETILEIDLENGEILIFNCSSIFQNNKLVGKASKGNIVTIKSGVFTDMLRNKLRIDTRIYKLKDRLYKKEFIDNEINSYSMLIIKLKQLKGMVDTSIKQNLKFIYKIFTQISLSDTDFSTKTKQVTIAKTNEVKKIINDLKKDFSQSQELPSELTNEYTKYLDELLPVINKFPFLLMNHEKEKRFR